MTELIFFKLDIITEIASTSNVTLQLILVIFLHCLKSNAYGRLRLRTSILLQKLSAIACIFLAIAASNHNRPHQ
ncbi:MAG: hypothetical protein V7L21_07285 [Nostoc sp.]|uniref:hypothetical protein n=1 Tax=Nostoc sp. TaxID=1180 RepID=UPI002FF72ECF